MNSDTISLEIERLNSLSTARLQADLAKIEAQLDNAHLGTFVEESDLRDRKYAILSVLADR
jgi:hypothetical protein